jgi:exodeoxyribonuclease VII large subunit
VGLFRSRPVLANPVTLVDQQAEDILRLVQRGVDRTDSMLERSTLEIASLRASTRALSPHATLERGYAIVHGPNGQLVSDPAQVTAGDDLEVRVKGGTIPTTVRGKDS